MSLWEGIDPQVAEARMRGLSRRLAELDEALKASQQMRALNPGSFSAELSLQSLTQMQKRLEAERMELVSHRQLERLEVALKGEAFADNTASIGQLGVFLIRLQKLYSSIAQAITTGPRLRGRISYEIRESTTLRFADVYPSSFGMKIYIKPNFDIFGESTVTSSLTTLFNLLNAAGREHEISRLSAELGQRSVGHLRHVLDDMARSHSGFELIWTDVAGTKFSWAADRDEIHRLQDNVRRFKTGSGVDRKVSGMLLGASLLRDRFEFQTFDQQIIDGKLARAAKPKIRAFFGTHCTATLEQVEIQEIVSGDVRTYYTLTDVQSYMSGEGNLS